MSRQARWDSPKRYLPENAGKCQKSSLSFLFLGG